MSEQPEALFLADELEAPLGTVISSEVDRRAAIELRRLHAVNAELLSALGNIETSTYEAMTAALARAAIARAEVKAS